MRAAFWLVLVVLAANGIALFTGYVTTPLYAVSGLEMIVGPGLLNASPSWIDPAVGMITQPDGFLAAQDWLHGQVPWWDSYAGVGMPLAAEMQSGAFFLPFVFLHLLPSGWLLNRVVLQFLSSLFSFALLKKLGLAGPAAYAGALIYGLSSPFFMTPHVVSPLPFLPLLVLGIETSFGAAREGKRLGWSLIVIALAYSVYAGFPETAFFNGMLAGCWALWRLFCLKLGAWWRYGAKLAVGAGIGLALTLPLVVPFLEYLKLSALGSHAWGFILDQMPRGDAPLQMLPYLYGYVGAMPPRADLWAVQNWSRLPFYVDLPVLALSLAALARPRAPNFGLRLWLVGFLGLWELRYAGVPFVRDALNLIPMLQTADSGRFTGPAMGFALSVLAGLAVDDHVRLGKLPWRRVVGVVVGIVGLAALSLWPNLGLLHIWYQLGPQNLPPALIGMGAELLLLGGLLVALARKSAPRPLLALALAAPFFGFLVPQLGGNRGMILNQAPIAWLQARLGTARITSLGPVGYNLPGMYHLASVTAASLPIPLNWANFIWSSLYPGADVYDSNGFSTDAQVALLTHVPAYQSIGVRYVAAPAGDDLAGIWRALYPKANPDDGLKLVYADQSTSMFELAHPASYMQAEGCTLALVSRQHVHAVCQNTATLLRRELFYPGWQAEVNGLPVPVRAEGIFQTIALPAGRSDVRFAYLPTHIWPSLGAALAALLLWLGLVMAGRRRGA